MEEHKPTLVIPAPVWDKIMAYTIISAHISARPIAGIGTVKTETSHHILRVSDAIVIKQSYNDALQPRLDPKAIDDPGIWPYEHDQVRLRWASVIDRELEPHEVRDIYSNQDWFVYLEVSRKGERKARLERYSPYRESIIIDVVIDYVADETAAALYESQVKSAITFNKS